MSALDLAARLALVKFITDGLAAARKDTLVPDAQSGWPSGTRMPVMFGGKHAGWAAMPEGSTTAHVADAAKLLAWAKIHQPGHVTEDVTVRVTPEVLAVLTEHLPGAIVRTPAVDPQWVTDVTGALKKQGYYVTRDGEKLTGVPGIEVSESVPVPRVNLGPDAAEVIAAAWAAGEIPVAELLALPPVAPSAPDPGPASRVATDGPGWLGPGACALYFGEDGRFLSPEAAARHAVEVQGGFSTPAREARRMVADGARGGDGRQAQMAREWLESRGLSLDGDDEPVSETAQ